MIGRTDPRRGKCPECTGCTRLESGPFKGSLWCVVESDRVTAERSCSSFIRRAVGAALLRALGQSEVRA